MTLWDKGYDVDKKVMLFTAGEDYLLDKRLVAFDCIASIAHAHMLSKTGLLTATEAQELVAGLNEIITLAKEGKFEIKPGQEDCHTAIEDWLTAKYGEAGKKIHTCRSRNDQVLTALRLYEKSELKELKESIAHLIKSLGTTCGKYGKTAMPGYTHMRKAMPTDVKTWLGCYSDALKDDLAALEGVMELVDQSPLGSAAGYGVPVFAIDKEMTAKEMGFSKVMENPIYCQHSRGKFEAMMISWLTMVMYDINRLASDLALFSMQEFGYVKLPKEFCTGSSIMPQKLNPDVLEIARGNYHIVLGEEMKLKGLCSGLMMGYNRDLQLSKEPLFKAVDITKATVEIMTLVMGGVEVDAGKCKSGLTPEIYATEEAYKLVKEKGVPFRDAYKAVAEKLAGNK